MTAVAVNLNSSGQISLGNTEGAAFGIDYDLYNYLGSEVALKIQFFGKVANPTKGSQIVCRLTWIDTLAGDEIYQVQGNLSWNEEDNSSLWNVAGAKNIFKSFELVYGNNSYSNMIAAILLSDAYNSVNSLGRNSIQLVLIEDQPPGFDADTLYKTLISLDQRPSDIGLNGLDYLEVYSALYRVIDNLNIPLIVELDPTLDQDVAISLAQSLDAQDHRVQLIWSPNTCRPRDASSLRGRQKPCYVLGHYLGLKALRNVKTTAQSIPMIADPVAGEPYPFKLKAMTPRDDVIFDEETIEALAEAKINVVRRINYDTGIQFVMSDVLTQYVSETSALRVVNAAEIACYTTNRVTEILKRHMLKKTTSFLEDAGRDITKFLNACYSAGLIVDAEDLGYQPYQFSLVPDESKPFERVRLYLARRPEGAVRSVIFDDVITK
ncbi:hypothetical protein GCM10023206_06920 [Acinetobacter puyangensis]|uniref:Phage tail sheath protein n=1 Tax=Acinetobacter puyangensis TaxID=1096779 RepID=A0A240E644_9GAMM|nr:hypothetical protein [Acinetobacter puyangensis]SNX44228.1 hypothetical protein SAMN05421731_102389 [Acinetobacter puyangensis]